MMRSTSSKQCARGSAECKGVSRPAAPSRKSLSVTCWQGSPEPQTSTSQPGVKAVVKRPVDFYVNRQGERSPSVREDRRPTLSAIYPRGSVCAVVLGGGESDSRRLFPLTEKRTLPAIPVGGIYRLIDVPLSNLLNSSINKIYVLTQYQSTSLNRYLHQTYGNNTGMPMGGGGFVEVVAATQDPRGQRWAEGPADTVRQWWNLYAGDKPELSNSMRYVEDVLILPSDQVYNIDFQKLVDFHRKNQADLTIVCRAVPEHEVEHFGICQLDTDNVIRTFTEKPRDQEKDQLSMDMADEALQKFMQEAHLESVPFLDRQSKTWVASCGMYLFNKEALQRLLKENPKARDFSKELIPAAIQSGMKVVAGNYTGYFVDVGGSIQEFYDYNIAMAKGEVPFTWQDPQSRGVYYSAAANLPPNSYQNVRLKDSVVGSGCCLVDCSITNSVVGSRANIGEGTVIEDSVVMGADYYESEKEWPRQVGPGYPHIGIGSHCHIKKAIVDKNVRLGNNVQLLNKEGVIESMDRLAKGITIRDGIIIVTKSAVVPDGTMV